MFGWLREALTGLFKEHTHCRCCKAPIKNGGVGFYPCGRGFCVKCRAEILRKR